MAKNTSNNGKTEQSLAFQREVPLFIEIHKLHCNTAKSDPTPTCDRQTDRQTKLGLRRVGGQADRQTGIQADGRTERMITGCVVAPALC